MCRLVSADVPVWPLRLIGSFLAGRWGSLHLSGGRGGGGREGRSRRTEGEEMIAGEMAGSGSYTDRKQILFLSSYRGRVQPWGTGSKRCTLLSFCCSGHLLASAPSRELQQCVRHLYFREGLKGGITSLCGKVALRVISPKCPFLIL